MAGPPPTPSPRRELSGDPGRRRRNQHEPQPAPADLTPPVELTGPALEIWTDLAPRLAAMKCLGDVDSLELATACRLQAMGNHYAVIAEGDMAKSIKRPSPALWAAVKCWEKAAQKFYRFGITPAERTKISTGGASDTDPFTAYREAKRAASA